MFRECILLFVYCAAIGSVAGMVKIESKELLLWGKIARFDVSPERIPRNKRSGRRRILTSNGWPSCHTPRKKRSRSGGGKAAAALKIEKMVPEGRERMAPPEISRYHIPNRCPDCGVLFRHDRYFEQHCARKHGNRRPHVCSSCGSGFSFRKHLLRHFQIHHGEEKPPDVRPLKTKLPSRCEACGNAFPSAAALEKHALARHEGRPVFSCPHCEAKFCRQSNLKKHVNSRHEGYDVLKCKTCKRKFNRSDELSKHEECCQKLFRERTMGRSKVKIGDVIANPVMRRYCELCDVSFKTFTLFRTHRTAVHPDLKLYKCEHCNKSYASNTYLDAHLTERHGSGVEQRRTKFRKFCLYECQYCKMEMDGVSAYEKHGRRVHPDKKLFHCGNCEAGFLRKSAMDRHLKEMHGDEKICCNFCSKCYHRTDRLRIHEIGCKKRQEQVQRRNEEGLYCEKCKTVIYATKTQFKWHTKTHDLYDICNLCGERFTRLLNSNKLSEHMRQRHPCQENIHRLLETMERVKKENFELKEEYTSHFDAKSNNGNSIQNQTFEERDVIPLKVENTF